MKRLLSDLLLFTAWLFSFAAISVAADAPRAKKIVLIAGKKSHGPEGNRIHDYPWSVKLLKVLFDRSNVREQVRVETHFDGWPQDERTFDDADTIVVISDGRDGTIGEEAPHFSSAARTAVIERQMKRGCGFVTFHFSTFASEANRRQILEWSGGYFQWETQGLRKWYSAIKILDAELALPNPQHPIARGVPPFRLKEEFYFNLRFDPEDKASVPLLSVPELPGRDPDGRWVAWARERADGGRGFGTSCGHFYDNWKSDGFRKFMLNAIAWSAHVEVPAKGVESHYVEREEITSALSTSASREPKPNIILILTDDQGWADLACQGPRKDVLTPNLDALAASGVRFARGYVSAPVCVPSRAGLVTGRYQTRFNIESNEDGPLPASERTIADRLKEAGYITGLVGKWHLASNRASSKAVRKGAPDILWGDNVPVTDANMPGRRGFDEYFCGAMRNYAASFDLTGKTLPDAPVLMNDSRFRVDVQTEGALAFLKRQETSPKPFFLYLAYFAPHVPVEAPKKYLDRFASVSDPIRRTGLAMISAVDDGVGRIRQYLQERGIEENTLIFFLSDNGAPTKPGMWDGSLNEPFVGEKGLLTDGGDRLPFLMSWPGRLPAGKVYDPAVISLDLMTTALAAAHVEPKPEWKLDGTNLLPYLTGERKGAPHEALFWRFRSQAAVLAGRWKLYFVAPDHWRLFDANNAAGERLDVAAQHPEVVADLQAKLRAWCAEQSPPGLPSKGRTEDDDFLKRHQLIEP